MVGAIGGWEAMRYLINRKSNKRIEEAKADGSEFNLLKEVIVFLQQQLKDQTALIRKLNSENLTLTAEVSQLKAERAMKLCEKRACSAREPQSGY